MKEMHESITEMIILKSIEACLLHLSKQTSDMLDIITLLKHIQHNLMHAELKCQGHRARAVNIDAWGGDLKIKFPRVNQVNYCMEGILTVFGNQKSAGFSQMWNFIAFSHSVRTGQAILPKTRQKI